MKTTSPFVTVCIAASLAFLSGCGSGSSNEPEAPTPPPDPAQVRLAELNAQLSPLGSPLPGSDTADLVRLDRVALARVVGLGEASHGTREFFQAKHKIFRWLVEERGFTVFAIESDTAEAVHIDRWVQTGDGDLTAIMLQNMHYWTWYTEEVRDLIEWMRAYNATRPEHERLRYVGVDCQTVAAQAGLIAEFVAAAQPSLLPVADATLDPLKLAMGESWTLYAGMSTVQYEQIRFDLEHLDQVFELNQAALLAGSSEAEFRMARHLLLNLLRGHDYMFGVYNDDDWAGRSERRERCLADNTLAIEELVAPGVRVALWGHNYHVAAGPSYDLYPSMGSHLRDALGQDYQVIGFSFTRGTLTAMGSQGLATHHHTADPPAGSVNELFHAAAASNFVLDLGALPPGSQLLLWLSQPRLKLSIGAAYNAGQSHYFEERVPTRYDALIHIDESTPTVPLPVP